MSALSDRLRGIMATVPGASPRPSSDAADARAASSRAFDGADAAETLGGQWTDVSGHRVLVVERVYRPGHRHGRLTLMDHVLPESDDWLRVFLSGLEPVSPRLNGASRDRSRVLFIDLETTGLAGGAGTYAFLVGCGWFDGCAFRVRQFFMTGAAVEAAMLTLLESCADSVALVVSVNGKSFDLPLIETRYVLHRRESPFGGVPHLDMLHPARRMWRRQEDDTEGQGGSGCTLGALESAICGHTREGDVPGFEIPARYFHYVRTGDASPLEAVFEHNRLDLVSLAFLTARAAQLAIDDVAELKDAREAVGLGQLLERAGAIGRAKRCFARAAGIDGVASLPGDEATRAEAMHAYAVLCRRDRRYADAAGVWRQLLALERCPASLARTASEALAVHHEHRVRDLFAARAFAQRSASLQTTPSRRQALEHRLARIDRKLVARPLPLFQ
jgi:uncharacterized protein YprB with RNaseH-like and TPR domain